MGLFWNLNAIVSIARINWWPRAELNHRHKDFQSQLITTQTIQSVTYGTCPR